MSCDVSSCLDMEVTDEEEDMEIWESLELHLDAVEPRGKIPTPLTATLGGLGGGGESP